MPRATHRVYLAPNQYGRFEQSPQITKIYFEVAPGDYLDAEGTRWYRITCASVGYAWDLLWKAAPEDVTDGVTVTELGARMHLFSNRWYADAADVLLEEAYDLRQAVITGPKVFAFVLGLLVFGYVIFMHLYARATGAPLPDFRMVARFAAAAMTLTVVGEVLFEKLG
jgi:hypothetical protein